jgi:tetratricopeptide (TPR) repeat protein
MLSSFGAYHVEMASSSEEAMDKCRFNFFDIILCDFNLGQGKNGQQILEALKISKRIKHTHLFIMITAETSKDVVLGTREYQPDAYIAKPITRTSLEKRLGHLIKQQKTLKPINKEIDLENYSKAISLCHLELDQKTKYQSWCYQTLSHLYLQLGDAANAIKIYETVLKSRDLPWAHLGMGQALLLNQDYKSSIDQFEAALKLNSNLVEAYDGISECYLKLNQPKLAQDALKEAVSLSPRIVPRQEKLGHVCQKNQDIEAATLAFRHAIKFGEHSIHDKAENYLNLGKSLSDWSESDLSNEGQGRASEAIEVLETLTNKFSLNENACISATLVEARVYTGQNKTELADKKLHQAECIIEDENLTSEVGLEFAKTLYSMNQPARAEKLLIDLAKKFEDNTEILLQIESLLDEPESLISRKQAKELNKSGIKSFEQGDLEAAIESIESAISFTPKHAALNLNLVQVLLKNYEKSKLNSDISKAKDCLQRIQHIPGQHNQYKRMKYLLKTINKLTDTTDTTDNDIGVKL